MVDTVRASKAKEGATKAKNAALEHEVGTLRRSVEQTGDEEALDFEEADTEEVARSFEVYGFFDTSIQKMWFDNDSVGRGTLNDSLTFLPSSVNLYLSSRLSDQFRALVELKHHRTRGPGVHERCPRT